MKTVRYIVGESESTKVFRVYRQVRSLREKMCKCDKKEDADLIRKLLEERQARDGEEKAGSKTAD